MSRICLWVFAVLFSSLTLALPGCLNHFEWEANGNYICFNIIGRIDPKMDHLGRFQADFQSYWSWFVSLMNISGWMVEYFKVYNFKIWWVGAYKGMGGYWNEYSTFYGKAQLLIRLLKWGVEACVLNVYICCNKVASIVWNFAVVICFH